MDFKRSWNLLNVYDLMIIALVVLSIYNVQKFGLSVALSIVSIVLAAVLLDLAIGFAKEKRIFFPKSALITGLILSIVVEGSLLFLITMAVIAILSKRVIRIKGKHIFNPAVFALFIALFLPVSQSWWGAGNFLLVGILGLVIAYKLKRFHLVIPFFAVHAALMAILLTFNSSQIAGHFLSGSLVFFAFYMLVEPKTSPVKKNGRVIFGLLAGIFAAVLYAIWLPAMLVGALFFADLCAPVLNRQGEKPVNTDQEIRNEPITNPNW